MFAAVVAVRKDEAEQKESPRFVQSPATLSVYNKKVKGNSVVIYCIDSFSKVKYVHVP